MGFTHLYQEFKTLSEAHLPRHVHSIFQMLLVLENTWSDAETCFYQHA